MASTIATEIATPDRPETPLSLDNDCKIEQLLVLQRLVLEGYTIPSQHLDGLAVYIRKRHRNEITPAEFAKFANPYYR